MVTAAWRAGIRPALRSGRGVGTSSTSDFPLIANAAEHLPPDTLLDGELVAIDQNGRVSFNLLQHHRSQAQAILFYAFDVIMHRGRNLRHVPLESRRELLVDVIADLKPSTPHICLSETIDATPAELIPLVKEFGFEASSPRQTQRRVAQIQGEQGAGARYRRIHPRQPAGCADRRLLEGDKLMFASKVRNGFVPRLRREVWEKLNGLEKATCPFANLPEKKRIQ